MTLTAALLQWLDALLWGIAPDPLAHLVRFVTGYVALFVGLFVLGNVLGALGRNDGVSFLVDGVIPAAIFGLPIGVGVLNGVLGGGLLAGSAIGLTPAVSLGVLGGIGWTISYLRTGSPPRGGDSSAWGLHLFFAGYGVVGALAGTVVGMALAVGVQLL